MDPVSFKREPLFAIGAASIRLGLSLSTLRMYEEEGLLLPYKTPSGRRIYSLTDLDWVDCIRNMIRERGLNIEGIRELLAMIPCWDIYGCLDPVRKSCEAYRSSLKPCWYLMKKACSRSVEDCRACEVYIKAPLWLSDPKGYRNRIIEAKIRLRKEE